MIRIIVVLVLFFLLPVSLILVYFSFCPSSLLSLLLPFPPSFLLHFLPFTTLSKQYTVPSLISWDPIYYPDILFISSSPRWVQKGSSFI
jgi:hypothetical protein